MINIFWIGLLSFLFMHHPGEGFKQTDPKAKSVLEATSAGFKQLSTVKANLVINVDLPEQKDYERNAVVYLRGQSYRIEMEDEDIICDSKSIWRHLKDMNEVQIRDYDPSDNEITPSNIFNIYENDFYSLYVEQENKGSIRYDVIELTPMDKSRTYFKVRVWINQADKLIYEMKVFDKNGTRYTYTISNLQKNLPLDDGLFRFDPSKFKDIWVEDLRF